MTDKRNIKPSQYADFKQYHIFVKDISKLTNYGFVEKNDRFVYENQRKTAEIIVWKTARHRKNSQMTFSYSRCLKFTIELCYLFANLLKDGIIEFDVSTTQGRKEEKIAKLNKEIERLTKEREELING